MNIERFAAIAQAVRDELLETESPSLLQQLATTLNAAVQDPAQASHQQQLADFRVQLRDRLTDAPSNDFSPAWAEALTELGIADLLGVPLRDFIEGIFRDNEITLSAAAPPISEKAQRLEQLRSNLEAVTAGLDFFDVGREPLGPGDYEIGFLMPRELLAADIERLGQEFIDIKRKILGPLLELTMGSRPEVPVRSIASSELEIFLHSYPAMMIAFVKSVDILLGAYQKILDIRLKHRELKDSGVPDDAIQGLVDHAEGMMEATVTELVTELLAEHDQVDQARANELRQDLTRALNALANRIDQGYTIEVRAGEVPAEPEDREQTAEEQEQRTITQFVLEKQRSLRFTNLTGKPILSLPERTDENQEAA